MITCSTEINDIYFGERVRDVYSKFSRALVWVPKSSMRCLVVVEGVMKTVGNELRLIRLYWFLRRTDRKKNQRRNGCCVPFFLLVILLLHFILFSLRQHATYSSNMCISLVLSFYRTRCESCGPCGGDQCCVAVVCHFCFHAHTILREISQRMISQRMVCMIWANGVPECALVLLANSSACFYCVPFLLYLFILVCIRLWYKMHYERVYRCAGGLCMRST